MDEDWHDDLPWKKAIAAFVVVIALTVASFAFFGTNVSRILSTVGASVDSDHAAAVPPADPDQQGDGGDADEPGDNGSGGGGGEGVDAAALAADVQRPDLLIIKTGEIAIQVESIGPAVDAVTTAIIGLGGYASGSQRDGQGNEAVAALAFRIPSDRWEAALAAVRGAGEAVLAEHTETVDVSGEVVDLHARIRNLEVTEAAFEAIMAKAVSIDDVLQVQGELTSVRGQIEQLEAKVGDLEERAALSTLTVQMRLHPTPPIARQEARFDPGRESEAATARLVSILQGLAKAGIWFGIVWLPVLIAVGIVLGVGFVFARWVSRRLDRPSDSLPDATGGPA